MLVPVPRCSGLVNRYRVCRQGPPSAEPRCLVLAGASSKSAHPKWVQQQLGARRCAAPARAGREPHSVAAASLRPGCHPFGTGPCSGRVTPHKGSVSVLVKGQGEAQG